MPRWLLITIQIVTGLLIVYVVYRMSLWLVDKDRLVSVKPPAGTKQDIDIIDGYAHVSLASNRSWNTINPNANNYRPIIKSYNRKGGIQFSYSFWLYIEDSTPNNVANRVILLRGDTKAYGITTNQQVNNGVITVTSSNRIEPIIPIIQSPGISFGNSYDNIVVTFNTLDNPLTTVRMKPISGANDNSIRHNLLKLMQQRWFMLTFTFEDNVAINDFEDGIIVRCYVNEVLYHTETFKSALKTNNGDVHIFPSIQSDTRGAMRNARVGNVKYYNYALGDTQVRDLFAKGAPKYPCKELMGDDGIGSPLYLSEYNKLDIYNT